MRGRIMILDGIAIGFLTLLSLNFLVFFGLQGSPLKHFLPVIPAEWDEVIFFALLAIVTGTTVHLLRPYRNTVTFLLLGCLWAILAVGFVFGIVPPEFTVRTIGWKILAFSYPLIYMYLIRRRRFRIYFEACAWIYTLSTLVLVVQSLAGNTSALTGAAGLIPFILTALFVSVSIYLACRLTIARQGKP